MRFLLPLLSTCTEFAVRHQAPCAFMPRKEPLATEEVEALAGVWRCNLDLDDGNQHLSLHLHPSGEVLTTGDTALPFNICHGRAGSTASWSVSAVPESG